MCKILKCLWRGECGSVMTTELVLVASVAVGGLLVGLEGVRDMLNAKVAGMGQAIRGIGVGTLSAETRDWASRPPISEADFAPFAAIGIPDEMLSGTSQE